MTSLTLQRKDKKKQHGSNRSWGRVDDAHAGRRCVVDPFPFLAVGMPDVVYVLLLELVVRHTAFAKLCSPERQGRIQ